MRSNNLDFWFPILKEMSINVPKTIIIDIDKYDKNCVPALKKVFWMQELTEADKKSLGKFIATMKYLGKKIGYPLFLRSGNTSYKHEWKDTCYVANEEEIAQHIQNIAEHSIMADMKGGWPINVWVVRKLIETEPVFTAFNEFPVTREFRIFFRDHKVECIHPYWPLDSIKGNTRDKDWKVKLNAINKLKDNEREGLLTLSTAIAQKFEGWWSLDWLMGKDGKWYAIDMATGEDSYHWKGCKYATNK